MEEHCFIISYDLCQPNRDYSSLYNAIKAFGTWGRLTESTWAIVSSRTCSEIRDYLMRFIDNNDRLIVLLCGRHAAWTKLIANNSWVKENLAK